LTKNRKREIKRAGGSIDGEKKLCFDHYFDCSNVVDLYLYNFFAYLAETGSRIYCFYWVYVAQLFFGKRA